MPRALGRPGRLLLFGLFGEMKFFELFEDLVNGQEGKDNNDVCRKMMMIFFYVRPRGMLAFFPEAPVETFNQPELLIGDTFPEVMNRL